MENLQPSVDKNLSVAGNSVADSATVFEVSEVLQADKPLPEIPYYEAVEALVKQPIYESQYDDTADETILEEDEVAPLNGSQRIIESCSQYSGRLVAFVNFHPVVAAIHYAFNDHRPLCLSPDIIWLLISQGLANHINANAEQLRPEFVKHQGKIKIEVRRDDFVKGSPENPWNEVFGAFSAAIRHQVGEVTHELLIPTFSTTGLVEKAAAEIVLLDAMQFYFEYELRTLCGIPKIKLEGTVTDWQELLKRIKELAQFGLQWWIDSLIPILDEFITAAQGKSNKRFWQSMYKFNDGSGGPYITGWITAFFPYLKHRKTGKASQQNPWLIKGGSQLQELLYPIENSNDDTFGHGLTTEAFPSGLAKAPFVWKYHRLSYKMEFLGGFVGVRQDLNYLFLRPEIGWAVREAATV